MNKIGLKNKVALITGATGSIGGAIAKHLNNLGCQIILTGTNSEENY